MPGSCCSACSTGALEELNNDSATFSYWDSLKDGILQMKEVINISIQNGFANIFPVAIAANKLRGEEDNDIVPMIVDLPDVKEKIYLYYINKTQDHLEAGGNLKIKLPEEIGSDTLIEIYNENDMLVKSVEDTYEVSCHVIKGRYKIIINSKYELSLKVDGE